MCPRLELEDSFLYVFHVDQCVSVDLFLQIVVLVAIDTAPVEHNFHIKLSRFSTSRMNRTRIEEKVIVKSFAYSPPSWHKLVRLHHLKQYHGLLGYSIY